MSLWVFSPELFLSWLTPSDIDIEVWIYRSDGTFYFPPPSTDRTAPKALIVHEQRISGFKPSIAYLFPTCKV